MTKYQWKKGFEFSADPQEIGERLELIENTDPHGVTPDSIVAEASNPKSPLHPLFDWDDTSAAHKHRKATARIISNSIRVRIVTETNGHEEKSVHAFINVEKDGSRQYMTTARVMSDDDLRRQALRQAVKQMRAFRERYSEFEELAILFASMEEIEDELLEQ